ncbi:MAG: RsmE family RNA methyltransferase, partial [Nitrospirota bacterium]
VIVRQVNKEPYSVESPISITLVQGIAKGEKMDLIIQKATELGVRNIVPLITVHAEVRHTEKLARWRKIAISASQQSGRDKVPEITEPVKFAEFMDQGACFLTEENINSVIPVKKGIQKTKDLDSCILRNDNMGKIIFSEEYKTRNLKQVLKDFQNTKEITIVIGPEGGFSKEEVDKAVEKGFMETSLGPRILRTETAPIAAISVIQYELGDMG